MENQQDVMGILGKDEKIDLSRYPEPLVDLPPGPDGRMPVFSVGDIHANPIKLVHLLVKYKLMEMKPEQYERLVQLYDRQRQFSALHQNRGKREKLENQRLLLEALKDKPEELAEKLKNLQERQQALAQEISGFQQQISKIMQDNKGYQNDPEYKKLKKERDQKQTAKTDVEIELTELKFLEMYVDIQKGNPHKEVDKLVAIANVLNEAIERVSKDPSSDPKTQEINLQMIERWKAALTFLQDFNANPQWTLEAIQQFYAHELAISNAHSQLPSTTPNRAALIAAASNLQAQCRTFIEYLDIDRYQELKTNMRAELAEFRQTLQGAEIKTPFHLRLEGDVTSDRGATDASVLSTLRVLAEKNPNADVMLSDHDIHLIEFIETGKPDAIINFNRPAPGQANSGIMLLESLEMGLVTMEEIRADYQAMYHGNLKAVGYELSPDGKHITLHAHAPIDWEVVESMAKFHGVPYRDQTPLDRAVTIDAINAAFQENYVKKGRVHELNHLPDEALGRAFENRDPEAMRLVKAKYPHYFSIWHHELAGKEVLNRPTHDAQGNTLSYTHGHTVRSVTPAHVANLDRHIGKPGSDVGESPVTATYASISLTAEQKLQQKNEATVSDQACEQALSQLAAATHVQPAKALFQHILNDFRDQKFLSRREVSDKVASALFSLDAKEREKIKASLDQLSAHMPDPRLKLAAHQQQIVSAVEAIVGPGSHTQSVTALLEGLKNGGYSEVKITDEIDQFIHSLDQDSLKQIQPEIEKLNTLLPLLRARIVTNLQHLGASLDTRRQKELESLAEKINKTPMTDVEVSAEVKAFLVSLSPEERERVPLAPLQALMNRLPNLSPDPLRLELQSFSNAMKGNRRFNSVRQDLDRLINDIGLIGLPDQVIVNRFSEILVAFRAAGELKGQKFEQAQKAVNAVSARLPAFEDTFEQKTSTIDQLEFVKYWIEKEKTFHETLQDFGSNGKQPVLFALDDLDANLKIAISTKKPEKMLELIENARKNPELGSKEMRKLFEGIESCAKSLMIPTKPTHSQEQLNQIYKTVEAGIKTEPHPFQSVLKTIPHSNDYAYRFAHNGTVAETKNVVIKALNAESRSAKFSMVAKRLSYAVSRIGDVFTGESFKSTAKENAAQKLQNFRGEIKNLKERVRDIEGKKANVEGREIPPAKSPN